MATRSVKVEPNCCSQVSPKIEPGGERGGDVPVEYRPECVAVVATDRHRHEAGLVRDRGQLRGDARGLRGQEVRCLGARAGDVGEGFGPGPGPPFQNGFRGPSRAGVIECGPRWRKRPPRWYAKRPGGGDLRHCRAARGPGQNGRRRCDHAVLVRVGGRESIRRACRRGPRVSPPRIPPRPPGRGASRYGRAAAARITGGVVGRDLVWC